MHSEGQDISKQEKPHFRDHIIFCWLLTFSTLIKRRNSPQTVNEVQPDPKIFIKLSIVRINKIFRASSSWKKTN
jgi:hypothetical protein